MEAFRPSRTAQGAAMHRAAHQLLDRPVVFEDPLAIAVIGRKAALELKNGSDWHGFAAPALRAFIVARSRYSEDAVADALTRGIAQYVLLGAGLDTYACRTKTNIRIFEVDHPATQAWKRQRLAAAGIALPVNLAFAPLDFERETLETGLACAGFDFTRPAMVAWLGVTPYLTRDAIAATLQFLTSSLARRSELIFDYAEPPDERDPVAKSRFAALAARVAEAGEPFRSFFTAAELHAALHDHGFREWSDLDTAALNTLYYSARDDGLCIGGHGHLIHVRW
ncbi:MAG TPA: class I SAM-dependent methyltransferase [Rhizomicrobium sp.]|jgi:methyltransferase (TIGR00027 family)|nr:class I SAM-dependent methyltransferase [Rhizomicrobium sp.]